MAYFTQETTIRVGCDFALWAMRCRCIGVCLTICRHVIAGRIGVRHDSQETGDDPLVVGSLRDGELSASQFEPADCPVVVYPRMGIDGAERGEDQQVAALKSSLGASYAGLLAGLHPCRVVARPDPGRRSLRSLFS